jgi:penicillin-binding protein A
MRIEQPFRQLLTVFILLFVVVSGTVVYWQVGQAQSLATSQYNPRHCVVDAVPQRGTIFDRNGVKLAWSVTDPTQPCGWRRHYADPSLAPVIGYYDPQGFGVTGVEDAFNDVLAGVQAPTGEDFQSGLQNAINQAEHVRTFGSDVYLTIDERIQKIASNAYDTANQNACSPTIDAKSEKGSIIVEDPHTGEILAMVSHPGYDNDKLVDHSPAPDGAIAPDGTPLTVGQEYWNQLLQDPNKPLIDRPIADIPVPGSSFKTFTLVAALDSGQFQLSSSFTKDEATDYVVDGFDISTNNLQYYQGEPAGHTFPMDLTHNYAYSNNVVFARVATTLGTDTWLSYANRFGISYGDHVANIDFDLPVTNSWVYRPGVKFDQVALANAGYGQATLQISPLVEEVILSTVAADGIYNTPHLEMKEVPHGVSANDVAKVGPKQSTRIISSQAAQGVREAMKAVVQYGSVGVSGGIIGAIANSPTLQGGKTGTGQVSFSPNSESWYISMAPDDVANPTGNPPRLAIVIQKEEGGEGACQSPISDSIYRQALPLVGYPING